MTASKKPILMILAPGKPPTMALADISWEKIDQVIDKFLKLEEEDLSHPDAKKLLRKLNPLVKPLAEHTRPGQVLVFSAIERLHQVPLHALLVDKKILIERNPVVYCSSLTILHVVYQRRQAKEGRDKPSTTNRKPLPSASIPNAVLFGAPPSAQGQEALLDPSSKLSLSAHTPDHNNFTTSAFKSAIKNPAWIYSIITATLVLKRRNR